MVERVQLAQTIVPNGVGYFPLYCAAHWIATRGGTYTFDPTDTAYWKPAFSELVARISSGQVSVTGVRDGIPEEIAAYVFASIQVAYPYGGSPHLRTSADLYLCSQAYTDEERWHGGFNDSLRTWKGVKWSKLLVAESQIARLWPFAGIAAHRVLPIATGAPGRPSSMHLVLNEYQRRLDRGEVAQSVSAEARSLETWLSGNYPEAPPVKAKSIENKIRTQHREAKKPLK